MADVRRVESQVEADNMFRSSRMSLIQLYIPVEAVQVVTLRAGDLGLIQFRDVKKCIYGIYSINV